MLDAISEHLLAIIPARHGMLGYVARRLVAVVPVLVGISVITFALIHLIPGDPVLVMMGMKAISPEEMEAVRHQLGLDKPIYVQYFLWLSRALQGDLGRSYQMNAPVLGLVIRHFTVTLRLATFGIIVSILLAIPVGVISATKKNSMIDYVSRIIASLGISLPPFFTGIMLILLFALYLGWFPSMGAPPELFSVQGLKSLVLPAFTVGFYSATIISRMLRATMLEVLEQDYIRTARSKGLMERIVIYRHALKNAMIPVVTIIGLTIGYLLGGTVVVETIFAMPGLGFLTVMAVLRRDYPLIQGIMLFFAAIFTLTNLMVDVIYGFLDPRIRYT